MVWMCEFQYSDDWSEDALIVLVQTVAQDLSFVFGEFLAHKDLSVDEWLHFGQIEITFIIKLVFLMIS